MQPYSWGLFLKLSLLFFSLLCIQPLLAQAVTPLYAGDIQKALSSTKIVYVEMVNYRPSLTNGAEVLNGIYQKRNYQPLWYDDSGFTPKAAMIVAALKKSVYEGLTPSDYFVSELTSLLTSQSPEQKAKADVLLTAAVLRYALDLTIGHPALMIADPTNFAELSDLDLNPMTVIEQIQASTSVDEVVNKLPPSHDHYKKLKLELSKILALAAPTKEQREAADKIRINMARWRWQSHLLGDRYVLVNITNARLQAYQKEKLEISFPVIVGKLENQTPVTSGYIRHIEIHPSWNIPPSIAKNEQLKKLQANPRHLAEKHIRLFSSWDDNAKELDSTKINWKTISPERMTMFRLRQDPGPQNSLGKMKFIFPNPWSIYLHDTPGQILFNETNRGLSHGCIRVHDPIGLAVFILNNQDKYSNSTAVKELVATAKPRDLEVKRPVAIHITYQTAWVDNAGKLQFAPDIYGQDKKILSALNKKL